MMIPRATELFSTYYGALSQMLSRILTMAEGGQFVMQGTDILSPAALAEAKLTVASFENVSVALGRTTVLKQNLGALSSAATTSS